MGIKLALEDIKKKHGVDSIREWGDKVERNIDVISTGCLALDQATGVGGLVRGRMTQLYGGEGCGKSTIALQTIAQAQKKGGKVVYMDSEYAYDAEYAEALGVNTNDILIVQPDSAEQTFDIMETLVQSGEVMLIVLDSVAALVSEAEKGGEYGDANMGVMARLIGQAMRRINPYMANTNTCLLFINQTRSTMATMAFAAKTTPTGGRALQYYTSLMLEISRIGSVKKGEEIIGNRTKIKIPKNKFAPPYKNCEFDLIFGEGTSREAELIDLAIELKVIEKGGAWLTFEGERVQGKDKMKTLLKENKDLMDKLEERVRNR